MKQTFVIEIILPNLPNAGFSECEIERALTAWRRKSFSQEDAESFTFIARQQFEKSTQTVYNQPVKSAIPQDEEKGFHAFNDLADKGLDTMPNEEFLGDVFDDMWEERLDNH